MFGSEYKEKIADMEQSRKVTESILEQKIARLEKENETLKAMLPRKKALSMWEYYSLAHYAEKEYGITCNGLTKSDVIDEIIAEESYLSRK